MVRADTLPSLRPSTPHDGAGPLVFAEHPGASNEGYREPSPLTTIHSRASAAVDSVLASLDEPLRQVVDARFGDELTLSATAAELGMSLHEVRTLVRVAARKVRAALRLEGDLLPSALLRMRDEDAHGLLVSRKDFAARRYVNLVRAAFPGECVWRK